MYELFLYESGDSLEYGRPCGKKEGSMDKLVRYVKEHVGKHYYAAVLKGSGENVTFTRGDRCIYARALKGASSTVQNVLTNILWLGNLLRATENDLLSIEVKDSEDGKYEDWFDLNVFALRSATVLGNKNAKLFNVSCKILGIEFNKYLPVSEECI